MVIEIWFRPILLDCCRLTWGLNPLSTALGLELFTRHILSLPVKKTFARPDASNCSLINGDSIVLQKWKLFEKRMEPYDHGKD